MERTSVLGDPKELLGDIYAPVGSRDWAVAARYELQKLIDNCKDGREFIEGFIESFNVTQGWKHLTDRHGMPFKTYDAFCLERRPNGLQRSRAEIDALIALGKKKTAQELAADPNVKPIAGHGEASSRRERNEDGTLKGSNGATGSLQTKVDNINLGGTSVPYLIRRLKRDHPAIAAALARGEYRSARAAGIAAGIVKVPTPLEIAKKAYAKMSDGEKSAFIVWLGQRPEVVS